ncbi:glycerol-3-phosphate dehydrogenase [Nematocida sp. AWRm80]|nr:glycerol-3-phosphate dehydrogenase [Nematocida sp. AWRm80]
MHHLLSKEEERRLIRNYSQAPPLSWKPLSRENTLKQAETQKYDIVIIGGGSAGAGCLLDAATRGYSAILLEREDYASGTSSKSTKLIHGGIRYLEKAIKELDIKQLSLVVEGLRERKAFLRLAPYLTREIGILLPIKNKFMIPYFWLGTKVYDWLSGMYGIQKSYFIDKETVRRVYPAINQKKIAGSMVYFDGQMDDSRVNAMLIQTANYYGAHSLNYTEVTEFKKKEGKIVGVTALDKESGKRIKIKCRGVINATGPFSDAVRRLDNQKVSPIIAPSTGVHLVLSGKYTGKFGLLNPSTKNGSVLFVLPWKGHSITGSTDTPINSLSSTPTPSKSDLKYIIQEMTEFVDRRISPRAKNILSAWAGIRPLALDPQRKNQNSVSLVRSHLIETSPSGLVTIAGGKWTSYREMAEETVTHASKQFLFPSKECVTTHVKLIGSHNYSNNLSALLSKEFGISESISDHLVSAYGDKARKVCLYAGGNYTQIHPKHPYITAEIPYQIDHEGVRRISDFLSRRSLWAYFDVRTANESIPIVSKEFKRHLNWSTTKQKEEEIRSTKYLDTYGLSLLREMERTEKVYDLFQAAIKKHCTPRNCSVSKVSPLIKKYFGSQAQSGFNSILKNKDNTNLPTILKYISSSNYILQ